MYRLNDGLHVPSCSQSELCTVTPWLLPNWKIATTLLCVWFKFPSISVLLLWHCRHVFNPAFSIVNYVNKQLGDQKDVTLSDITTCGLQVRESLIMQVEGWYFFIWFLSNLNTSPLTSVKPFYIMFLIISFLSYNNDWKVMITFILKYNICS